MAGRCGHACGMNIIASFPERVDDSEIDLLP